MRLKTTLSKKVQETSSQPIARGWWSGKKKKQQLGAVEWQLLSEA
jgi:hypothetical protein